jgi:hypothetical protein
MTTLRKTQRSKRPKRLAIHARADAPLVRRLDDWRRKQVLIPGRSEAVCILLQQALRTELEAIEAA